MACVIRHHSLGDLYVQVIDAYGFQRELIVQKVANGFRFHVYQHTGRRDFQTVTNAVGEAFIERFEYLTARYPEILFNRGSLERARNAGFVSLCERLHRGEKVSASLL